VIGVGDHAPDAEAAGVVVPSGVDADRLVAAAGAAGLPGRARATG
jgi:hypothetical protein